MSPPTKSIIDNSTSTHTHAKEISRRTRVPELLQWKDREMAGELAGLGLRNKEKEGEEVRKEERENGKEKGMQKRITEGGLGGEEIVTNICNLFHARLGEWT